MSYEDFKCSLGRSVSFRIDCICCRAVGIEEPCIPIFSLVPASRMSIYEQMLKWLQVRNGNVVLLRSPVIVGQVSEVIDTYLYGKLQGR